MASGTVAELKAALTCAGKGGISVADALKCIGSAEALDHICQSSPQGKGPRPMAAFIVPDASSFRVVHGYFWSDWAVKVIDAGSSDTDETWILPRAWYDIFGSVVTSEWRACLMHVCSHAVLRPGISIAHLVELMGPAWTRAEVLDAVSSAQDAKLVQQKITGSNTDTARSVREMEIGDDARCLYPGSTPLL